MALHQRHKRLDHPPSAEDIGLERLMDDPFDVCLGGDLPSVVVNSSVIDQYVEPPEFFRDLSRQLVDALGVDHVELLRHDPAVNPSSQFSRSGLAFRQIASTENHRVTESSQLANDLVSDATVTAADERDSDVLFRTQIER